MSWIENFDLFLFDFDGLLVNTEPLHHRAYVEMLKNQGFTLDWSFAKFCFFAHANALALKQAFYTQWPDLNPNWEELYQEKKKIYLELVHQGYLELMPGAAQLLSLIEKKNKRRVVVTHSPQEQIDLICSKLPLLRTIPHFVTRAQYKEPKPHPECYLKAIELYGQKGDRIIGFEDSIRGWTALKRTPAKAILVCLSDHPLLPEALKLGAKHYTSLNLIDHTV